MDDVHEEETRHSLWIGLGGNKLSKNFFLTFDYDQSLLLPDGENIGDYFEDCDPDREEYEGFTGNAGPTLEYWYYKSAVVFWPRSKNLAVNKNADVSLVLSYLNCAPQTEVPSIATALVERVEKNPRLQNCFHSSILHALDKAKDENLFVRFLRAVNTMSNSSFAEAFVQVISSMKYELIKDAALDFVLKVASSGNSYDLMNVCMFCGYIITTDNSVNKMSVSYDVRGKIVDGALRVGLGSLTSENLSKITEIVSLHTSTLRSKGPDETFKKFAFAAKNSASQDQVKVILKAYGTSPTNIPDVLKLYDKRSSYLTAVTIKAPPHFSWRQAYARFCGSNTNAVNEFLRSEQEIMNFYGYNGIKHARNWANKYFGYSSSGNGYSANAVANGRGSDAYVTVTKTKR
uniref:Uncharacterized protein n=1 Tax=Leptocylindrus danicus TaxID=163516 RepID=A0A7S2PCY9_9STRA